MNCSKTSARRWTFEHFSNGLEEYYPAPLRATTKLENKVKLAKFMGAKITKEDFENNMPVLFQALEHCWMNAYQD